MALTKIQIGEQLRLRERFMPIYPYARLDQRGTSRSDLPAGSKGIVRMTHGTEVKVEVFPGAASNASLGVDMWVNLHMMDVLFEAVEAEPKQRKRKR